MAKLEVTKTIDARKMNKRNRQFLSEPPVTIPYGGILEDMVENRDMVEFTYLGELYSCKLEVLRTASRPLEGTFLPISTTSGSSAAAASAPQPVTFVWEKLSSGAIATQRAKVPGGWFVLVGDSSSRSVTFYPDASHQWDGKTI